MISFLTLIVPKTILLSVVSSSSLSSFWDLVLLIYMGYNEMSFHRFLIMLRAIALSRHRISGIK